MSKARSLADLGNVYDDGALSHRNLIINGAMRVHQRNGTTSVTSTSVYTVDRFKAALGGSYTVGADITQDSDAPDGFSKSLKVDITSTSTPATSNNFLVEYRTESQDMLHLDYGSSTAKYLTLSFWVKSNKTGTYGFAILHHGKTRNWLSSYTIDAADTWEYKTILIDPDTSTAFDDDENVAFRLNWHLSTGPDDLVAAHTWAANGNYESATGQVNLCDSTSNYWQLTGVQLEVGDTATPFEHRSYGDELARCRRYYQEVFYSGGSIVAMGQNYSSGSQAIARVNYLGGEMRAVPTVTLPTAGQSANELSFLKDTTTYPTTTGTHTVTNPDTFGFRFNASGYSGMGTSPNVSWLYTGSGGVTFKYDAEL